MLIKLLEVSCNPIEVLPMHKCAIISGSIVSLIGLILVCLPVPQPELTIEQKLQNPSPEQQTALINSILYRSYEFKRCMVGAGILGSTTLGFLCFLIYDSYYLKGDSKVQVVVPVAAAAAPPPLTRPPTPPRPKTARPPLPMLSPIEIIEHI